MAKLNANQPRPASAAARAATPARPAAAAPGAAAAPAPGNDRGRGGRDDRGGHRKELHLAEGKGGKRDKKQRKPSRRIRVDNVHGFEQPVAPILREVEVPEAITGGDNATPLPLKAVTHPKE